MSKNPTFLKYCLCAYQMDVLGEGGWRKKPAEERIAMPEKWGQQLCFIEDKTLYSSTTRPDFLTKKGVKDMSVAKVIEVISEGDTIEEAIKNAAKEASKTLKNIRSIYAEGIQAMIEDGKVTAYRVNCKVTFVIN